MNNNENTFDVNKFIPIKEDDTSVKQGVPAPVTHQMHQDFGNANIQAALSGEGGMFNDMIQGMMAMESADMSTGDQSSATGFLGNMGIQRMIMRKGLSGGRAGEKLPDASDSRIQNIKQSGGTPLSTNLLTHLNAIFHHDFSHVRIHTSGKDNASADAVNSHAFTLGNHIYFNAGEYNPSSARGMEVLVHELTHVVQHDEGRISTKSNGLEVSDPSSSIEREAYKMGANVSREYGGFRAPSAEQSISSTESMFDNAMPTSISDYMTENIQSPVGHTLDNIILDAMRMASAQVDSSFGGLSSLGSIDQMVGHEGIDQMGGHQSIDSVSSSAGSVASSGAIMREAQSPSPSPQATVEAPNTTEPTLPTRITIDGGRLGELQAVKQSNGAYKIDGSLVDLVFSTVRPRKVESGWESEIVYNVQRSDNDIFKYNLLGNRRGLLTIDENGVGKLRHPEVESGVIEMGGIGKVTISDISFDEGGFSGSGEFTPTDECFSYLKDKIPGAKINSASVQVSRSHGEWDASGEIKFDLIVNGIKLMAIKITVSKGEEGPEYAIEGTLSLATALSEDDSRNASITGEYVIGGDESYFSVKGEVTANDLFPTDESSRFLPKDVTGTVKVGYHSLEGFSAEGSIGASLQLPFASSPWRFRGGLEISEEEGILVKGNVRGTQDITPGRLSKLGSVTVGLEGETVWDVENAKWQSTELKLNLDIGEHISGKGKVSYDGETGEWDTEASIKGSYKFTPFGRDKKIPEDPINLAEKVPRMQFPVFGPIVLEAFVEGTAGLKIKPPQANLSVEAGLNFNGGNLIDSLEVNGGVSMEAQAFANASVNAGVALNLLLARGGAGVYGELGVEASAKAEVDVGIDLLKNGAIVDGGFDLRELNAQMSMDALIYGELGLYAYVDSLFTSEKRFEYPIGRVDIAKWGPIQGGLGIKEEDGKMNVEAEGITGYNQISFDPLKQSIRDGIEYLKDFAGYGDGTDIEVVVRNDNYRDENEPEFFVNVNGHSSKSHKIPRGRVKTFTMNAKTMNDEVKVELYDDDWGWTDDKILERRWTAPFDPVTASDKGVSMTIDMVED